MSFDLSVHSDAGDAAKQLLAFANNLAQVGVVGGRESAEQVRKVAAFYEAPAKPSYMRTGQLKASWFIQPAGSKFVVSSSADYARWVRGRTQQAWMHQGRWRTMGDIEDKARIGLRDRIIAGINNLKARIFG